VRDSSRRLARTQQLHRRGQAIHGAPSFSAAIAAQHQMLRSSAVAASTREKTGRAAAATARARRRRRRLAHPPRCPWVAWVVHRKTPPRIPPTALATDEHLLLAEREMIALVLGCPVRRVRSAAQNQGKRLVVGVAMDVPIVKGGASARCERSFAMFS